MTQLPADFDGIFRFTNFTSEDFRAKWANIEYTFPAMKTTPMIIPSATPEEVQHIRKKFAKELAVLEFYKTPKFTGMNSVQPGGVPALYTDSDLAPFIQKCLEPLPIAQAKTKVLPKTLDESKLRKDDEGKPVSRILKGKESLIQEGSVGIE
jgi:hypothetical protein